MREKEKGNWSEWDRHFHFIHLFFFINQFPNFVFSMYKITNIPKSNITGFFASSKCTSKTNIINKVNELSKTSIKQIEETLV